MKVPMKKLKTILLTNKYGVILIFIILISLFVTNFITFNSKYNCDETSLEGYVINKKIKGDKLTITLNAKEKVIVNYYNDIELELNDYIKVSGKMVEPSNNTVFNTFNYKKYLYNNKIFYIFNANKIEVLKNNTNIFYKIKKIIKDRINNYTYSKEYLEVFILGNKNDISEDQINMFNELGIIHLFSISGMHISIFILFLNKLFKRFKYKRILIILFLIFYLFLTSFTISIVRCFLCYLFRIINKKYNLNLNNKNILFIVCSLLLIINPFYIYNVGFLYSFIISYSIINHKGKRNYINITLISFFSSLPILINTNYSINILSIICNILFIPYISLFIFPLSIITFMFPFLDKTFSYLIDFFINVIEVLSKIDFFTFPFSKQPIIFYLIYYYFLFFNNKKIVILLLIMFYFYNYYVFNPNIYFIDVGQGDCILIRNKNKNILIDTGGNYNYNLSKNNILFFKSIGIKKMDYLIISHGDYDHMGEAINLVNNFKVEKVIFNCGPYNDLENELIKVLDKKKIKYYSCIKELNIDNKKLYFLQTKEYDNENDNSNVIYTELNGYKFMFMGDAGVTTEKEILEQVVVKSSYMR